MSKVAAYYHIVWCTKERRMTMPLNHLEDVYRFIWKIVTTNGCKLIRIGGIQNHIHMLIDLNSSVSLGALMKEIKAKSSGWLRRDGRFPEFSGWATGYYAATVGTNQTDFIVEYIKGQREHHLIRPFDDEIISLYELSRMRYDDKDLK